MPRAFATAFALVLLACLLACLPARAADAPRYSRHTLELGGRLLGLAAGDVDGDGLADIAAVSLAEGGRAARHAEVFVQKRGGGFAARPSQSWPISADAAVFDLGDVTGGGERALCYLAPDGLYAYLRKGGSFDTKPVRLIKYGGIFQRPDPRDMPRWPLFGGGGAGGGGGADAAMLPGMNSLGVYISSAGRYKKSAEVPLPVETTFAGGPGVGADGSLTVSHRLPVVSSVGFDRPGGADVLVGWEDKADVYLRREGGYGTRPDVSFRPGLVKPSDDDTMGGAWLGPFDLDGDGRTDFVVVKKTGGMAHTKSLVFIYRRGPDGSFPAKPSHTIITEGVVGPRFVDLNGDGRLDILLPSVKVGVSNFINILTSGKVTVDVAIYVQDAKGGYPDAPTATKGVEFKLDLTNIAKAAPVLETGRFTKGKGYGLAVVSGEDRLSVYLPDRYSILSDRPGIELDVAAPTELTVADLNADGVDDMVLTYRKSDKLASKVVVFLSR